MEITRSLIYKAIFSCSFNIGNEITVKRAVRPYIFQMIPSLSFSIFLPRYNAFSTVSNSINEEKDMQVNACYKNNNLIRVTNGLKVKYDSKQTIFRRFKGLHL